jgi:hypothetical protein
MWMAATLLCLGLAAAHLSQPYTASYSLHLWSSLEVVPAGLLHMHNILYSLHVRSKLCMSRVVEAVVLCHFARVLHCMGICDRCGCL